MDTSAATKERSATDAWPAWRKAELERNFHNGCVGVVLVSETERVRVWHIRLKPGERLPFHRHVLDYFWTAVTDGRSRSHYHNGRVSEGTLRAGDSAHLKFGPGEFMVHDLENIGDTELVFVTVEHLQSPNTPLPLPERARRAAA
jgi:quercetin dioxygenase-like cupin family protein